MTDDPRSSPSGSDVEMPLPPRRRGPRPAAPSRAREITNAAATIFLALLGLIFYPDLMTLAPPLPTAAFWILLAVFHLAAADVAARSIRGRHLWTPTVVIVCVGGGATIVAITLAYLSNALA
ncbi:hypothetical protein ACQPYK_36270 [Streptosporangium sp. CA-135522]|uniref:hypothetical protein n=1 Tax=Streptosporangium sp. CA-135522 TaxID=3240072 RepID=UPI003D8D4A9F